MTDNPNQPQNDPKQSDEQTGEQQGQQSGQQQRKPSDTSQKRPSQGGTDVEQDQETEEQGEKRRAS